MIATSAVALTLATTAMADAATTNHSGFYLGGSAGYAVGKTDSKTGNTKTNLKAKGPVFGLHTGYQHQINMFVMGLEASANLGDTKNTKTTTVAPATTKTTLKRDLAFGLATRLGVAVNNWMFYTKLGFERANFKLTTKTTGSLTPANNATKSGKARANGFVAGLGAETVFDNGIMLGGEWTFTKYSKLSTATTTYSPRIHDFKVRLGYKF